MKKQVIETDKAAGTWAETTAQATMAGSFVFVSGQVPNKPGTKPRALDEVGEMGTLVEQTRQVLENIGAILEAAGTSFDNVVKRNVYMTHVTEWQPVYKIFEEYFPSRVASTGVITGLIPFSARLEIDVIAVVPDSPS